MRAGGLHQWITVQLDQGTTRDSVGGRIEDWQDLFSCHARFAFQGGAEFERAAQVSPLITELIVTRWRRDIDYNEVHAGRVLYGTRTLDILFAVDVDKRRREVHIHARERH